MKKTIVLAGAVLLALPAALSAQQVSGGFQLGQEMKAGKGFGDAPFTLNYAELGVDGNFGGIHYGIRFDAKQDARAAFINPEFALRSLHVTLPLAEGLDLSMGKLQMPGSADAMRSPLQVVHGKAEINERTDIRNAGVAVTVAVDGGVRMTTGIYNRFEVVGAIDKGLAIESEGKYVANRLDVSVPGVEGARVGSFFHMATHSPANPIYGADAALTLAGVTTEAEVTYVRNGAMNSYTRGMQLQAGYELTPALSFTSRWNSLKAPSMIGFTPGDYTKHDLTAGISYQVFDAAAVQATFVREDMKADSPSNALRLQLTAGF